MPYYEIIYETGTYSVAEYASDDEAVSAVKAQHDRAINGEKGGPSEHPAERISRVLKYDAHPADETTSQVLTPADVTAIVKQVAQGDMVSVPELGAALRDAVSPIVEGRPHDTNYFAKESAELPSSDWQAA